MDIHIYIYRVWLKFSFITQCVYFSRRHKEGWRRVIHGTGVVEGQGGTEAAGGWGGGDCNSQLSSVRALLEAVTF